jgi:ADP-heptose:LPS heptosyltransferase
VSADGAEILVIKHGALGDFLLSMGPFAAIRAHHRPARITLLTTAPYENMAIRSGHFDRIWCDPRAKPWHIPAWLTLRRRLRRGNFARVYDLQTSSRSSAYFRYFYTPRPEWSGIAPGCSHPHANRLRDTMHTVERQREQLAMAGIDPIPDADLSWLDGDISGLLPDGPDEHPYVLLVAGGSAHRPEKRWPARAYGELAAELNTAGYHPVLIGAAAEQGVLADINSHCPAALNLCGRTDFGQIAALARAAVAAVGNDTGPMHIVASVGCPATVIFSAASDPDLTAPRGARVRLLQCDRMADLPVDQVRASLTVP